MIKFIDLFAGIGGIRLGFENFIETECVFSSEWDKFAQQTYKENFGELPQGDITQIKEDAIPKHDVLLAGFPCQPFSNIGKREGFGHETQGSLFFDILRIITHHKPKAFLLENVPGLLTIQKGETFELIKTKLEEVGYNIHYKVLDGADFGLPQYRKRIYIVGFHKEKVPNYSVFNFPNGYKKEHFINEYLQSNMEGYSITHKTQHNYLFKVNDGKPQIVDTESRIKVKTLVASYHKIQRLTGTFVRDGETGLRLLSEYECKKIMGFPDEFIFPVSRTQMYRQLGNSVAVPVVKEVSNEIKKTLGGENYNEQIDESRSYEATI